MSLLVTYESVSSGVGDDRESVTVIPCNFKSFLILYTSPLDLRL